MPLHDAFRTSETSYQIHRKYIVVLEVKKIIFDDFYIINACIVCWRRRIVAFKQFVWASTFSRTRGTHWSVYRSSVFFYKGEPQNRDCLYYVPSSCFVFALLCVTYNQNGGRNSSINFVSLKCSKTM